MILRICRKVRFKQFNKELNTLISLMSLSAEATEVVSDRVNVAGNWGLIGSTVVTGIVIVFLILAILIFFLLVMGKIFQGIENSKKKKKEEKQKMPSKNGQKWSDGNFL